MASCQALYRNYVLTLVPYSEVTIPRLMSYNLHIVLYGFQPLFGCLACIYIWFATFSVLTGTYLRDRTAAVILLWNSFAHLKCASY